MGATVVMYFLKWVEAIPEHDVDGKGFGGGGGPQWVEEHISDWVNIAGTLLGVSKSMTAFLSGEMKDTVEIVSLVTSPHRAFFQNCLLASRWILGSGKILLEKGTSRAFPKMARKHFNVDEGT